MTETSSGGPTGGPVHKFICLYQDIVENERIVYTYVMYVNDTRISVSLASIEFEPVATGTRLVMTERRIPRRSRQAGVARVRQQRAARCSRRTAEDHEVAREPSPLRPGRSLRDRRTRLRHFRQEALDLRLALDIDSR